MTFLAIDIGNTRLKWALYAGPRPGARLLAHGAAFHETIDTLADTDWKALPAPASMLGCAVAGDVVRRRTEQQLELWDIDPRWIVPAAHECGVVNGYEHPSRLGADRWAALVGARQRVLAEGRPRPALVVMVGTAVTVDAIDADGHFLGGLILPGFGLMLRALEMGTAGLKVPTGEVVDFPTNTSDALMSGGAVALAGAVERQHRRLLQRTGASALLLMTGGAAVKLAPMVDLPFEIVDTLIFEGLLAMQAHRLAL
ncbi:type III pantothenate kinase [Rubrivivax gelatinosus]|uniref:Type III pantothenate kinase n=1 Tax=Rubrivivax gelatinosus TaxID=28068 RepID=A0ABS1DYM4_RUBGE|nr:type III pantothenate kinase [Rubrivivax gelatinosus]MBK1615785.1 type III pantothenate kinase [Rubrivivax gelatinosus]MBK1714653.1 type III pantothenate kinase [Rubrivivax gelatinosus]